MALTATILFSSAAIAQNDVRKLRVGDTLPDIALRHIINYKTESIKPSSFRGKWLLLDFWSPSCVSCLKAFPRLQQLQQQFSTDVVIMPVSFTWSPQAVQKFLEKRKSLGREIKMPTAVYESMDNEWIKMFPTDGFPQVVWIDRKGRVRGLTGSDFVTESNLRKLVDGTLQVLPFKSRQASYSRHQPLLTNGNGGPDTAFRFRSLITGYIDSIPFHGVLRQKDEQQTRLYMANETIASLVKAAWYKGKNADPFSKKLVLEVADPSRYVAPAHDSNYYSNLQKTAWCYDLVLPPSFSLSEAWRWMLSDLERYFKITVMSESRKTDCWVLSVTEGCDRLATKGGTPSYTMAKEELRFSIRNRPVSLLVSSLSVHDLPWIVDETAFAENIDIDIELGSHFTLEELNKALQPYGLKMEQGQRVLDVVVIKEGAGN